MKTYTEEVLVPASRERIIRWLSDPFLIAGVIGHLSILQVYDPKTQSYVSPSLLSGYCTRFKVIYIFGTADTKLYTVLGEMRGPIYNPSGITYEGNTSDGKLKWSINFQVRVMKTLESLVRASVSAEYEMSLLDRLFDRSPLALAEHIIKDHLIPYIKYYFKPSDTGQLDITPTVLYVSEGSLSEIIPMVLREAVAVQYGVVTIEGDGIRGKILIKNGRIERLNVNYEENLITSEEALPQIKNIPNSAKVTLFSVDVDTAVMTILERAHGDGLKRGDIPKDGSIMGNQ
ncbi:hypothetical protein [Stygiolobus caldivivus]|uniref:Uncharacterized protein n=1 Tax=Stygiolobus caldivivus TaxID=2824673 RepID=A0A8D5U9E2_9CREN|nr:hypothetical protein [Stygiolobus caldivivus]BCU71667.1 hypothetical protein KN1_29640 [Stygiolobus caldivivus]